MNQQVIQYLPLDRIDTEPQVREVANDGTIRNLSMTLGEIGLQQPIRVRRKGDRFT